MFTQIVQNLSRLWPQSVQAAPERVVPADDGATERGWHASSWALNAGLQVSETPLDAEAAAIFADTVAAFHPADNAPSIAA